MAARPVSTPPSAPLTVVGRTPSPIRKSPPMASTETAPRKKRRRPALSCIECRRRKVKCDRLEPCDQCVLASHTCEYDDDPRRLARKNMPAPAMATKTKSPSPLGYATLSPKGSELSQDGPSLLPPQTYTMPCYRTRDSAWNTPDSVIRALPSDTSLARSMDSIEGVRGNMLPGLASKESAWKQAIPRLEHALDESVKFNQKQIRQTTVRKGAFTKKTRLFGGSHVAHIYEHVRPTGTASCQC